MKRLFLAFSMILSTTLFAGVDKLTAEYRNGQLFLRWNESGLDAKTRLSVWSSADPITLENIASAERCARYLNVNSAVDWWLDLNSFFNKNKSKAQKSEEIFAGNVAETKTEKTTIRGFVIEDGGKPIPPAGGLHVHTPKASQQGKRYYAVTTHDGFSDKITGFTATASPVEVGPGKANPIRLNGKLTKNSAKGLPIVIKLHGRGGGSGIDKQGKSVGSHIIFSDDDFAWREGIPFKFTAEILNNVLILTMRDRVWIGRSLTRQESRDSRDYVPAIASFWLGYNVNIAVSNKGPEFIWDNYTERMILHVARWAQEYLGGDKNRTYVTGGSMGGTGTVQLVTHFPEFFAAGAAKVPVYSFSWKQQKSGGNSMWRMTCSIGPFTQKNPARFKDGTLLEVYTDGARNIARPEIDMPPLFATNGRQDASIPWINNPPFYKAANDARQMFSVYWNNGTHSMSKMVPKDFIKNSDIFRYKLNESFPAFSNSSDNRNYGNGDHRDGDLAGWINRGFNWKNIVDTPRRYSIILSVNYPGIKYPVTADVTIRRRQNFKFAPGTSLKVSVNGKDSTVKIDKNGLLTIEKVTFADAKELQINITE